MVIYLADALHAACEHANVQGKPMMTSFSETLSKMLGSTDVKEEAYEQPLNIPVSSKQQRFNFIEESADFTADDAARELGRPTLREQRDAQVRAFLKGSKFSGFEGRKAPEHPFTIVKSDNGKSSYKITDTSKTIDTEPNKWQQRI